MIAANDRKRPDSLDTMLTSVDRLFGYLMERGKPLTPRPSDIIISPYGKCGTTWLQQTLHSLRTRGDTDYDDISRVVPWIETAPGLGLDLDAEQRANPRCFKSHLNWTEVPKGGRYIVSFRDPEDAAVSFHKFFEGWFFEPGTISLDEFVMDFYVKRPPESAYWQHLASWWEQRDNPDVLLLTYESMKSDPALNLERIAGFAGIELDEELREITLTNSSLTFMQAHKDKFDDLLMRELSEKICPLPEGSDSAKVRVGQVGDNRLLLCAMARSALQSEWDSVVGNRFGFRDYEQFRQTVDARHN